MYSKRNWTSVQCSTQQRSNSRPFSLIVDYYHPKWQQGSQAKGDNKQPFPPCQLCSKICKLSFMVKWYFLVWLQNYQNSGRKRPQKFSKKPIFRQIETHLKAAIIDFDEKLYGQQPRLEYASQPRNRFTVVASKMKDVMNDNIEDRS